MTDQPLTMKSSESLFQGTAWYYSRYRGGYPSTLFDRLLTAFSLDSEATVLDLGCGTGQVTIPLANIGAQVFAVDPDVDMLCEGIRTLSETQYRKAPHWILGSDSSLDRIRMPQLRLCTMGASFHWTDRESLLARLNTLIEPDGAVVILSRNESAWSGKNGAADWREVARRVVQEFLGERRRAGSSTYDHPPERHEVVLSRSPFSDLDVWKFQEERRITCDDIIGLQLSTSYASPSLLGDRVPEFTERLRACLLEVKQDGVFAELSTTEAIVATRPA